LFLALWRTDFVAALKLKNALNSLATGDPHPQKTPFNQPTNQPTPHSFRPLEWGLEYKILSQDTHLI